LTVEEEGSFMRIRAAIATFPLLVLAACGSASTSITTTGTGTAGSDAPTSGSASASPAANLGPAVPPATAVAAPVAAAQLPAATGKAGVKPTLTFPKSTPPPSLQRTILSKGNGPLTKSGDYLATNYLGQVWGGKIFDNSYDRKKTSVFQIASGKVVPGWVVGLSGVPVGSRVLLSLPPADGYGSTGNSQAGIKGTDTIVFVIDVVSDIPRDKAGQTDAVIAPVPKGLPTVTGALGKEPKITIAKGLAEPKKNAAYVLAKGTGPKIKAGSVLAQLVVSDWTQSQVQSTYPKTGAAAAAADPASTGLQQISVDTTGALKDLIGLPIGSRVLVLIAGSADPSTGQKQPSAVAVVDLVAQA
jgi:peptidylprolyl isomerase